MVSREPGTLSVGARIWGDLYIDGEWMGRTPQVNLPISTGSHVIRVVRDGFEPFEEQIIVAPGQDVRITDIVLRRTQP